MLPLHSPAAARLSGVIASGLAYRQGTLSIDIFDGHSHRPVWHGWAHKELTRADIEHSAGLIREAVDSVLAQFPPK